MTLQNGFRLGSYEIVSLLGAGGMGEVYRARDTKLGREIAIKVLPEAFAQDPQRLARFEREARLLASLNHPNIATLHGLEESRDTHFLVMELVPGETLAERLAKGRLDVEESLPIFRQIAEALEAAHEKGIIHRDLKPANIKVTPEGRVKVLDFGLAKAFSEEVPTSDLSQSPTATREGTRAGVIMGTASYMSPEQARGKPLDKRTDIWSFGCVLYEALTGRKAFEGETLTDIFAAIVKNDPDWSGLPASLPGKIHDLLHRCLRKDPRRRLREIGDARIDIEDTVSEPSATVSPATGVGPPRGARAVPILVAALMAALVTGIVVWRLTGPAPQPLKRFAIHLPPMDPLSIGMGGFALSADGRNLVCIGTRDGVRQLFLRPMDELGVTPVPGTEGALWPFFSPDGQWVGFFADGMLKKVSLAGGASQSLCEARGAPGGASWGPEDSIVFSPSGAPGLLQVSASGGTPQVATSLDTERGERAHLYPQFLPNGKAVLFTAEVGGRGSIVVQSLETGERRTLAEGGEGSYYVPTGHIIFWREGSLLAVAFDAGRLEAAGPAVPLLDGVTNHSRVPRCSKYPG